MDGVQMLLDIFYRDVLQGNRWKRTLLRSSEADRDRPIRMSQTLRFLR